MVWTQGGENQKKKYQHIKYHKHNMQDKKILKKKALFIEQHRIL
jgi:hypothetical protein